MGCGKVRPEELKVKSIREFPVPTQIRSFLGLTGYYRKFIPQYASLAAPLTDQIKKSKPSVVDWTPDCSIAFQSLKNALCSSSVPTLGRSLLLQTDASDRGVGAVLSQVSDGEWTTLWHTLAVSS